MEQELDGLISIYCYTLMKWLAYRIFFISKEVRQIRLWQWYDNGVTMDNNIGPWAQMRLGPGPKWERAPGPNEIGPYIHGYKTAQRCLQACNNPGLSNGVLGAYVLFTYILVLVMRLRNIRVFFKWKFNRFRCVFFLKAVSVSCFISPSAWPMEDPY